MDAPHPLFRHRPAKTGTKPGDAVEHVLINPATEEEDGSFIPATRSEVADATNAARRACDGARRFEGRNQRIAAVSAMVEAVGNRREAFAQTISREIGAPIDFSRKHHVARAIGHVEDTLAALKAHPDEGETEPGRAAHRVRYEPAGVAALITPWNWPLNQLALKTSAALAAGCAIVVKPSEFAPRTAVLFAEAMAEALEAAGAPATLFNLVLGGPDQGEWLARDPSVDIISFTGSTRTGGAVCQAAAMGAWPRPVLMELGGKSPNLLFADCDLQTAARQGVAHCFRNSGQSCNAASRMLIERSIYREAIAAIEAAVQATEVGAPDQPGGHLGPLANRPQFERVRRFIDEAEKTEARLIVGGPGRADGFDRGFYARPTLFADIEASDSLFQREIFGPVLTLTPFDTEQEAIALANRSDYGLAAYIQTADHARADRVARQLRVGMVQVNGVSRAAGAPFGGVKASGFGREAGIWGIRAFQNVKSISGAVAY